MSAYRDQLLALHTAVITGNRESMLPLIKPARHNAFPPALRLSVYANGYETRLREAVTADYPATAQALGQDRFKDSVTAYICATPSCFWDLNLYSIGYAAFLKDHLDDHFPQDLAALESAIIETYWMPESEAWRPEADLKPETLLELPLRLRAASRLLALRYPVDEYLTAFRKEDVLQKPPVAPAHYLVLRHQSRVRRHALDPVEYQALQQQTFGAGLGLAATPEQAKIWLTRWIKEGFLRC